MKKTRLADAHALCNATFEDSSGFLMPRHYGDVMREYSAVRDGGAGVADVSHRGRLSLGGREHIKFLQGMLTNDVAKLEIGKGLYAALLTPKGRMITDMTVYREADSALLDLEPGLNEKVREMLIKFRVSYKATVDDATERASQLSIQGAKSRELIEQAFGAKIPELSRREFAKIQHDGCDLMIAERDRTGSGGYDIFAASDGISNIWERLTGEAPPIGTEAMEILRIEAAIPRYGADMDENTIPIEAGIWDAISFEKGCYVGQEVIARIKWRGHVNRHLAGFAVEGGKIPDAGAKIFHEAREIGHITSSALSPHAGGIIALGYARREFIEPGTGVSIAVGDGEVTAARIVKTPFYGGV